MDLTINLTIKIALTPQGDYSARVKQMPQVATQYGETPKETVENLMDTLTMFGAYVLEVGK